MMQSGFEYSSTPRSVGAKRSKYREQDESSARVKNLMHDRRVMRGNTYAMRKQQVEQGSPAKMHKQRKTLATMDSPNQNDFRPSTPPAVDGRKHMDIQTDNYLEELSDKVPEMDVETQTEAFMDRPPAPLFIPQKSGVDAATQIEHGDLFDFDLEVEPILEVLVGKTLEVSMMEVLEEEEITEIRKHQDIFEQARNAELAEIQRLEAEAKRKFAEKQRRLNEEKERVAAQAELEEKVAARSFAKHYLVDLHTTVFSNLMESGHFYDPLHREIYQDFLPFLIKNSCARVENISLSRDLTNSLLSTILANKN